MGVAWRLDSGKGETRRALPGTQGGFSIRAAGASADNGMASAFDCAIDRIWPRYGCRQMGFGFTHEGECTRKDDHHDHHQVDRPYFGVFWRRISHGKLLI